MPTRAMSRASATGLPTDTIADIAGDTKGYQQRLAAFREQEATAGAAVAAARKAAEELERQRLAHQEEAARVAVRLAQHAEEAEAKVAELSRWQDQLQSLERALGVREAKATAKQDQANMNMTLLSDRSRAMDEREADVTRRETALAKTEALLKERDADVGRREGLLKNRVRQLNADL